METPRFRTAGMDQAPPRSDSYDPRTWPEPGKLDLVPASGRHRRFGIMRLVWLVSALLLIGGAAASWLTRAPAGPPLATRAQP